MAKARNKRVPSAVTINDPDGPGMIKAITKLAQTILQRHWDRAQTYRGDSVENAITINLTVDLDYTDTSPSYDVKIRYSKAVTDHLKGQINPNQGTFTELEEEVDGDEEKDKEGEHSEST